MAYQSSHTGQAIDEAVIKVSQLLDLFYPVGSIYTSTKNTNPAATLGGTWTQIKDRFLLCAGDSYSAGATGGSATHIHTTGSHTLTVAETPAHTHTRGTMNITGGVSPAHSSGVCWYNVTGENGAFYSYENVSNNGIPTLKGTFTGNHMLGFDASRSWTGETSSVGEGAAHNHGDTGSTSNLPPYKVVYAWERTA